MYYRQSLKLGGARDRDIERRLGINSGLAPRAGVRLAIFRSGGSVYERKSRVIWPCPFHLVSACTCPFEKGGKDFTQYVNPFIGCARQRAILSDGVVLSVRVLGADLSGPGNCTWTVLFGTCTSTRKSGVLSDAF
jgi:hypothetical protein